MNKNQIEKIQNIKIYICSLLRDYHTGDITLKEIDTKMDIIIDLITKNAIDNYKLKGEQK